MAKSILPVAAMEKLLKKAGASRVSEDAKESLREILEEYADKILSLPMDPLMRFFWLPAFIILRA